MKIDFEDIVWEGVDWIYLTQDREWWWLLVNTVWNLKVPWIWGVFFCAGIATNNGLSGSIIHRVVT